MDVSPMKEGGVVICTFLSKLNWSRAWKERRMDMGKEWKGKTKNW